MSPKTLRSSHAIDGTPAVAPIKRSDAYRLYQTLSQLKSLVSEPKYLYALVMARRTLQPLAEAIEVMIKPTDRLQEFERRRQALCIACAMRDTSGQPQISPEQHFVIAPEQRGAFEGQLQSLQQEYEQDLQEYQVNANKISMFLSEPAEIGTLPTIPISALTGSVSFDQMDALFPLLENDVSHSRSTLPVQALAFDSFGKA